MNSDTSLTIPDWLAGLFTADHETGGCPSVPQDHLDEAREWLAAILVDVPDGLVPHIRQLELFYQGTFRAPLSRCLMSAPDLEWPPPDPRFRQTNCLNAEQLAALSAEGLPALGNAKLFPEGEPAELARLLLNPYALFDLSDWITYSVSPAWQHRMEVSGRRLVTQFDLAMPQSG